MEWPSYLDEYEKLVFRMTTPRYFSVFFFASIFLLVFVFDSFLLEFLGFLLSFFPLWDSKVCCPLFFSV